MKKELKEYLEIANKEALKTANINFIIEELKEYASTCEEISENSVEYQIGSLGDIYTDVEDENEIFDRTQTAEAKALLQAIVSDLEDYQERVDREYEEEREAMNRAYRNAKGFN